MCGRALAATRRLFRGIWLVVDSERNIRFTHQRSATSCVLFTLHMANRKQLLSLLNFALPAHFRLGGEFDLPYEPATFLEEFMGLCDGRVFELELFQSRGIRNIRRLLVRLGPCVKQLRCDFDLLRNGRLQPMRLDRLSGCADVLHPRKWMCALFSLIVVCRIAVSEIYWGHNSKTMFSAEAADFMVHNFTVLQLKSHDLNNVTFE